MYEGATTIVEHQDKDQAAGLEMADSFILCSHHAFKTHIKSIDVFIHEDDRMEVSQGRFANKEGNGDLIRDVFLTGEGVHVNEGEAEAGSERICVN